MVVCYGELREKGEVTSATQLHLLGTVSHSEAILAELLTGTLTTNQTAAALEQC